MDTGAPSTSTGMDGTSPSTSNTATPQKPKIDPLQLLKCLSILLNPRGGIRGVAEVHRVKGLMTKYSKKLVSKCIYLNILQATDLPLLDLFYEEGGWELVGAWLQEAVGGRNWPLATQVLTLMEASPLTLARLKRNSTPKLVKDLSRDTQAPEVQAVAKRLVQKWMEVVRQGDCVAAAAGMGLASHPPGPAADLSPALDSPLAPAAAPALAPTPTPAPAPEQAPAPECGVDGGEGSSTVDDESSNASTESEAAAVPASTTPIRITIRSGSQVLAKVTSQRPSQDSTDSDDNKPLSVIREEVQQARQACPATTSTTTPHPTTTTTTTPGAVHTIVTFTTGHAAPAPTPAPVTTITTTTTTTTTTSPTTTTTTTEPNTTAAPESGSTKEPSTTTSEPSTATTAEPAATTTATTTTITTTTTTTEPTTTTSTTTSTKPASATESSSAEGSDSCQMNGEATPAEREASKDGDKNNTKRDKEKKSRDRGDKGRDKEREKRSSDKRDKERSRSSRSSRDRDRDRSKDSRSSDRHRSSKDRRDKDRKSSSSSRKSSSRDKDKEKEKEKDKDKEKREKEKKQQETEDRATLEKVKPLSVDGLAKIPRKTAPPTFLDALGSADADLQAPRKSSVKTYKSRGFRNTGLLDEPALPPKKTNDKKAAPTTPGAAGVKRTNLEELALTPPDKRLRSSVSSQPLNADKPGGVKLISPKRPSLSDDGGFMAALTAAGSEGRKKVTRKRKSSESEQKDATTPPKSEEEEPATPVGVKTEEKPVILSPTNIRPTFNFYQETLKSDDEEKKSDAEETNGEETKKENEENEEEMEGKEEGGEEMKMEVDPSEEKDPPEEVEEGTEGEGEVKEEDMDIPHAPAVPAPAQEDYEKVEVTFIPPDPGTVRSVLVYHRPANRRRKTVKWRPEEDLQQVFYFELDETERVNVNTVKFNELMAMEKQRERENMMGKSRGLHGLRTLGMGDDPLSMHHPSRHSNIVEYMRWSLLPVMLTGQPNVSPGGRSQERHTQAARQTSTMPAFFHPAMLPETPREPDPEMVQRVEAKEIPLNDVLGQDNLHDHRDKFWPEPLMSEPPHYPPYPGMGGGGMGGGGMPGGGARGGGSHWVIGGGGPPAPAFSGGPMYGGGPGPVPVPVPGGPGGPCGYGGPGSYGGDMGEGMDGGPGWGGPGPDYPGQNVMMMGGGQAMMMGGHPNIGPRNMMPNMGMGGGGPRFRGRGGGSWGPPGRTPPPCKHYMNGHCRHGKNCKFLHSSPH